VYFKEISGENDVLVGVVVCLYMYMGGGWVSELFGWVALVARHCIVCSQQGNEEGEVGLT